MHLTTAIPIFISLTVAAGALASDDPLWHLNAPGLETILRDGTVAGGDSFRSPIYEKPAEPINVPRSDVPSPGGSGLLLLAGLRAATRRSR